MRGFTDYKNMYRKNGRKKAERKISDRPAEDDDLKILETDGMDEPDPTVNTVDTNVMEKKTERGLPERLIQARKQYMENIRTKQQETVKKEMYIESIIDRTLSFTKVFPQVNHSIEKLMSMLAAEKAKYKEVVIKYGLTLLGDEIEPLMFENGEYFTESENEFCRKLRSIEFYGGSEDGTEDLVGAVETGLGILNHAGDGDAYRGLLLLSDSLPEKDEMTPCFRCEEADDGTDQGLDFAIFYTYTDEFNPDLNFSGDDENREAVFHSLEDLIKDHGDTVVNEVRQQIHSILYQRSV